MPVCFCVCLCVCLRLCVRMSVSVCLCVCVSVCPCLCVRAPTRKSRNEVYSVYGYIVSIGRMKWGAAHGAAATNGGRRTARRRRFTLATPEPLNRDRQSPNIHPDCWCSRMARRRPTRCFTPDMSARCVHPLLIATCLYLPNSVDCDDTTGPPPVGQREAGHPLLIVTYLYFPNSVDVITRLA